MPVIDSTDYKEWAGITGSDQDAAIAAAIPAVQTRIEGYCGRKFDSAERTETYDGLAASTIQVAAPPVSEWASVSIDYGGTTPKEYTGTDLTDLFATDDDKGIIGFKSRARGRYLTSHHDRLPQARFGPAAFPEGFRNVSVTYTGGYATGSAPADLQELMFTLVRRSIARKNSTVGVTGEFQSEGIGGYTYSRKMLDEAIKELRHELGPFVLARAMA